LNLLFWQFGVLAKNVQQHIQRHRPARERLRFVVLDVLKEALTLRFGLKELLDRENYVFAPY